MSQFTWGTIITLNPTTVHLDGDPADVTVPAIYYGDSPGTSLRVRIELRRPPLQPLIVPHLLSNS